MVFFGLNEHSRIVEGAFADSRLSLVKYYDIEVYGSRWKAQYEDMEGKITVLCTNETLIGIIESLSKSILDEGREGTINNGTTYRSLSQTLEDLQTPGDSKDG